MLSAVVTASHLPTEEQMWATPQPKLIPKRHVSGYDDGEFLAGFSLFNYGGRHGSKEGWKEKSKKSSEEES